MNCRKYQRLEKMLSERNMTSPMYIYKHRITMKFELKSQQKL